MKTYNGHKNYNYWNVSLWINNDEDLYRIALDFIRRYKNRKIAAQLFSEMFEDSKTPDGVPFRVSYVYSAMEGMK